MGLQFPIVLDVSEGDIARAMRNNPCCCPLAIAFERKYPGSEPYVNGDGCACEVDGLSDDFPITDEATAFIRRFDAGWEPGPCTIVFSTADQI